MRRPRKTYRQQFMLIILNLMKNTNNKCRVEQTLLLRASRNYK
jgi:hypothetical protein